MPRKKKEPADTIDPIEKITVDADEAPPLNNEETIADKISSFFQKEEPKKRRPSSRSKKAREEKENTVSEMLSQYLALISTVFVMISVDEEWKEIFPNTEEAQSLLLFPSKMAVRLFGLADRIPSESERDLLQFATALQIYAFRVAPLLWRKLQNDKEAFTNNPEYSNGKASDGETTFRPIVDASSGQRSPRRQPDDVITRILVESAINSRKYGLS
jgi:hypothetical protein